MTLAMHSTQRNKILRERRKMEARFEANGDKLPRETWIQWAGDIKAIQRAKSGVAEYITARCGESVPIKTKVYQYEYSNDLGDAVESMKLKTADSDDHLEVDMKSRPIPTFQKSFGWDARDNESIEDGQNGDLGRNTRQAAIEKVEIAREKLFITGGKSKVDGRTVLGLENHEARNQPSSNLSHGSLSSATNLADTWQKVIAAALDILDQNNADMDNVTLFCNSRDFNAIRTQPYNQYHLQSVGDFVRDTTGVVDVVTSSYLTRNSVVAAVVNPTTMVAPVAWQTGIRPIARVDEDDDYRFKAFFAGSFEIFEDGAGNSSVARVVTA